MALAALLVVVALCGVWHLLDQRLLRSELRAASRDTLAVHLAALESDPAQEYAVVFEAGRVVPLVGPAWGKVEMYSRARGDAAMKSFESVEFHFAREGGEWTLLDSARCTSAACKMRAHSVFGKTTAE